MFHRQVLIASACLLLCSTGCTYRGIPNHGGGKRFYLEQVILSRAAHHTLKKIPWRNLAGKKATLWVYSIGDAGGGVAEKGGFDWGGAVGTMLGTQEQRGDTTAASRGGGQGTFTSRAGYASFAFANAEDIDYLKGMVIENLVEGGVLFAADEDEAEINVYVMVDNFGTNKWRWDIVVYATENLSAQVRIHAFAVDRKTGAYTPLGDSAQRFTYWENFIFNVGPLNNGEVKIDVPTAQL